MEDKNYGNEKEIFRFSYGSNGSFTSIKCVCYTFWRTGFPVMMILSAGKKRSIPS